MIYLRILGLILLHLFLLVKVLTFTAWPEMLSYGFLIDRGFYLYRDFAHPYEPLLSVILAMVYKIFGFDIAVLEIFTWGLILTIDLLIAFLSVKLIGKFSLSLVPLSFWVIGQSFFQGNALWFDLGNIVFIILSLVCIATIKNGRWGYFFGGVFLGLGFLVKQQQAMIFILLVIYWIVFRKFKDNQLLFWLGGGLVGLITLGVMLGLGILPDYLFWTVVVPIVWYPKMPGYTHLPGLGEIVRCLLIFAPGLFLAVKNWSKIREFGRVSVVFFLAAVVTALPRFEWFRLQGAVAIFSCLIISLITTLPKRHLWLLIVPTFFGVFLVVGDNFHVGQNQIRFYDNQTVELAKIIKKSSDPSDRIYLLNLSSTIYVLADRLPPRPWVDNYVWYFEIPGVQTKAIDGFIRDQVKVVVWKEPKSGNWFDLGTYQPKALTDYIRSRYRQSQKLGEGVYLWQKID